ncbi:MAG: hypothetical protein AABY38_03130 [Planctomycetota bacterium]
MQKKLTITEKRRRSNLYRLSENVFTRQLLYYILINYFSIDNILYTSVGTIPFSDNLFIIDKFEHPTCGLSALLSLRDEER